MFVDVDRLFPQMYPSQQLTNSKHKSIHLIELQAQKYAFKCSMWGCIAISVPQTMAGFIFSHFGSIKFLHVLDHITVTQPDITEIAKGQEHVQGYLKGQPNKYNNYDK